VPCADVAADEFWPAGRSQGSDAAPTNRDYARRRVDAFWSKLSEGGEEGPRGWLKERYGVSWQIVPTVLPELIGDPDREKSQRVMRAMLNMKKIEIDALERAAAQA
jgi:hypothetical protein